MIPWIDAQHPEFPDPETALSDPDGLLAAGGDLSPARLIDAYQRGIFPWYSDDQPILWWSPNPRCVLKPCEVHISRSLKKHIRKTELTLSFNQNFAQVVQHCSRQDSEEGTWITDEMFEAYCELNHLGVAHSLEVWQDQCLVGGLYGLAMGQCFFGESMFSHATNASKVAFIALCKQLERWQYQLIDCQVENPHLLSLGAACIEREQFLQQLAILRTQPSLPHNWRFDADILATL